LKQPHGRYPPDLGYYYAVFGIMGFRIQVIQKNLSLHTKSMGLVSLAAWQTTGVIVKPWLLILEG
jgi:hypothetical protein